jgi:cation diffusion facilitator family transporter
MEQLPSSTPPPSPPPPPSNNPQTTTNNNNNNQSLSTPFDIITWERRARWATGLSLGANLLLLISNSTVFFLTSSLSLLSAAVDSFLDLVSQLLLAIAMRGNHNVDKSRWPLGRARLEPVSIIIVSSLMGSSAFQVVWESLLRIGEGISSGNIQVPALDAPKVGIVSTGIVLKLILYVLCQSLASRSASIGVLAEDHRNDVLANSVALGSAIVAANTDLWFFDEVGAILISIYIAHRWLTVGREQTKMLIGHSATPDFIQQVRDMVESNNVDNDTDISSSSSNQQHIMTLDVVRAYHFGPRFLVEVEVVVPRDTSIVVAHDEALALQKRIEQLEEVERCHVHVDYMVRNEDEHEQKFHAIAAEQEEVVVSSSSSSPRESIVRHRGNHRRVGILTSPGGNNNNNDEDINNIAPDGDGSAGNITTTTTNIDGNNVV